MSTTSDTRTRAYTVRFRPALHRRMRIAALEAGRPLNQILNDLLELEFPARVEAPPPRKARRVKPLREVAAENNAA